MSSEVARQIGGDVALPGLADGGACIWDAISGTSSTARGSGDVANVQSEPPLPKNKKGRPFRVGLFVFVNEVGFEPARKQGQPRRPDA
jgi:hypothetical protein